SRPSQLKTLEDAARARGVEFSVHRITQLEEIAPAVDAAKALNAAGLNVLASSLFSSTTARSFWTALRHCDCRRCINGLNGRRRAALLATDPASFNSIVT